KQPSHSARDSSSEKCVVDPVTCGVQVLSPDRVFETSQQAANVSATACGGKAAAFPKQIYRGKPCCAPPRENLDCARNRIGPIKGALRAMDDLHLFNIVQREVGEIQEASRFIHGRAVNQDLGEIRIASIDEDGGQSSHAAGACE